MAKPGMYRSTDESPVTFMDALNAWTPVAHEELSRTARHYTGWITYTELAETVQDRTGIRTTMLMQNWIGRLLGRVAEEARRVDEPLITALCVDRSQRVGAGYAQAIKISGEQLPDDLDEHAAAQRLLCYRRWATDLPEDGGQPMLTPKVDAHRTRSSRKIPVVTDGAPALCPNCFIAMPASGVCGYC